MEKNHSGGPIGLFMLAARPFYYIENHFESPGHQILQETKNLPLDEIYLEYGLRFELEFLVWAPEPKKLIFGYFALWK